ncbi:Gti1/Pac2 family protein [Phlyctema vagabunda]|uniref:Gti1/Pac2 family protein n=1 Tax=Phlyctema vagabunda TaxID=108571 RepID=A0ABR4PR60_9HELO
MGSSPPLAPTFHGHIASTQDALILFEACLSGHLSHVARRPHDRERQSLIKSGNVFIYEEHSSGIKRWTDGVPWSPSRILGNFLVYRELERPFPPGEKKRAMKRNKRSPGITKAQDPYDRNNSSTSYNSAAVASGFGGQAGSNPSISKETERSLIGSLVDSYGFKDEGLVKKTVSVTVGGVSHHLVSYYSVADVMANKFTNPSKDPRFANLQPRQDLITKQNFRTPIDEIDNMDSNDPSTYSSYPFPRPAYAMTNQSISHRPMPLPAPMSYPPAGNLYNYGMSSGAYTDSLPASASAATYGSQFSPTTSIYPPVKPEGFDHASYRQQRYHSVAGVGPDSSRAPMPAVSPHFARRSSSAFEHSGSMDSAMSGLSAGSIDSKLSTDSGYMSQSYYSGGVRESPNPPHHYTQQRSLPTPTQPSYDRPAPSVYPHLDNATSKESVWPPMGNTSTGHGHYMAPQQQWTSTGTS